MRPRTGLALRAGWRTAIYMAALGGGTPSQVGGNRAYRGEAHAEPDEVDVMSMVRVAGALDSGLPGPPRQLCRGEWSEPLYRAKIRTPPVKIIGTPTNRPPPTTETTAPCSEHVKKARRSLVPGLRIELA